MQPRHPESPDRLAAVMAHLGRCGLLDDIQTVEAEPIDLTLIEAVHAGTYIGELAKINTTLNSPDCTRPWHAIDPDTGMNPHTFRAARLASGAAVQAVQGVLSGSDPRAFCVVRPPGHHAERDAAMGFCFFNSVAIAARWALDKGGLRRVAIVDFDVHHGNGTVDIFCDDPRVLVCSAFQHPFYPNRHTDTQAPNISNLPLPAGTTGAAWRRAIASQFWPAIAAHQPDLVLVSAGFDGHRLDPLGGWEIEEADYAWIAGELRDLAPQGRVVSLLEGGYDLNALSRSVEAYITAQL